ncbi:UDP-glucose 4-epimerase GalE [Ekhidna sp.]|uniref:UDP-glucose 4-epimerase GalE n=1 Tax=Ekhidna sp. TaxID=2608089 RepID=UPI0035157E0D
MKNVLVTGGLGFIGSHTCVELLAKEYNVIVVDNLSNSLVDVKDGIETISGKNVDFERLDLTEVSSVRSLFKNYQIDAIIHFAASKAVGESVQKPLHYYNNNVTSLINLLNLCQEHDVNEFVFSSSCTVYGQPDVLPVTEASPKKEAESPYGNTKQIGEEIIEDFCKSNTKFKAISLRYFNPIGAHESAIIGELPLGVPNNLVPFITQTAAGIREKLNVFGGDYDTPDGTCIRDYIHVVDLAKAHISALEFTPNMEKNYEFFNVGTGKGHTVLEVINSFESVSGQKLNYEIVDRRPGDVEKVFADTSKVNRVLGWKPTYNLDNMMESAWKWQKALKTK